jgi:hypothetical protein
MNTKARPTPRAVPSLAARLWLAFAVLAVGAAIAALRPAAAQDNLATAEELRELVGPIALYPDDLVAIVLPASTYPLQVVQAARFLEDQKTNSNLKPNEDWDDSVVALLNYPEVIQLLNDDLDWTYDLGTAVLNQRADVLSAIQDFRDEAYAAGNLRSDERQTITRADDAIEIKPADPQVIYVPYYEPEHVVVYQSRPVYYYYPDAYPVYYYPYPSHYHFHTGFFWGVNTWFSIGWHSHYLHVYDPFYYGHPYYGHTYYNPFYVRNVYVNVNRYYYPNNVWEPRYRYGGRPVVRGSEGRVYTADRDRTPRHGVLDSSATRSREGSVDRARDAAAPGTSAANGTPQPRRGVTDESYRNRNATGTQPQTTETAQANRTRNTPNGRSTTAQPPMGRSTQANEASNGRSTRPQTPPGQARPPQTGQADASGAPSSQGASRNGGGMSQALGRSRAAGEPSAGARTSPGAQRANPSVARANPGVSPRASEGSTGMPRESSRSSAPPRQQSAPPPRQQSFDASSRAGGTSAQRSEPSGGHHGNAGGNDGGNRGNSGGGSNRGGGERSGHAAARHER